MDIILGNIEKSKEHTAEKIKLHREEISRSLKEKLLSLAKKRMMEKEAAPSWHEASAKDKEVTSMIVKRIEKCKFMRKIRPTLKAILVTLVVHHFMKSVMILLENHAMQEEDNQLSPAISIQKRGVNKTELSKARLQRDSRFNYGMLAFFQESSKLRMVINRLMTTRIESILEKKQDTLIKAATRLTIFGKRVARRRLIDLCILVSNLNSFISQRYAARGSSINWVSSMPETSNVMSKQIKLLGAKTHLNSSLLQKHRAACTEFTNRSSDITGDLLNRLNTLLREFLPFSLHWSMLQFDRSYFLLKKNNLSEDHLKIDITSKLRALEELYSSRSTEFTSLVTTYKNKIHSFMRMNPFEVERKRTEYIFSQSYDHIDKLTKALKPQVLGRDSYTDYLPYRSTKWAFLFAEAISSDMVPSMNFEVGQDDAIKFLETYNKILKSEMQLYVIQASKSKRRRSVEMGDQSSQSMSEN
jgi:hypothetical protein